MPRETDGPHDPPCAACGYLKSEHGGSPRGADRVGCSFWRSQAPTGDALGRGEEEDGDEYSTLFWKRMTEEERDDTLVSMAMGGPHNSDVGEDIERKLRKRLQTARDLRSRLSEQEKRVGELEQINLRDRLQRISLEERVTAAERGAKRMGGLLCQARDVIGATNGFAAYFDTPQSDNAVAARWLREKTAALVLAIDAAMQSTTPNASAPEEKR